MAQYTPSFVDTSGFANPYAQGIINEAKIKQQQDQLVQSQLDDFEKNFNTEKLRDQDLPVFTSAFKNYKEAALRYSRLNRGGAKPEEIAAASALKDRALNDMNSIYSKSASANQLLKERADYRRLMAQKGYTTTDDVNNEIMQLSTSPVTDLDLKNFTSPYDKPIYANDKDYQFLYGSLKTARTIQDNIEDPTKSQEIDIKGYGKVKIPYMVSKTGSDINDVIALTSNALKARPALNNTAIKEYTDFVQKLAIPDTETDPTLASERELAKKKYNQIMQITGGKYSLSPELLLASSTPAFTQSIKDIGLDKKVNDAIQAELKRRMSGQRLSMAQKALGLQFEKFGYLQDKDMRNLYFKTGSENIPAVIKSANKAGVNIEEIRKDQKEAKGNSKKKGGNAAALLGGVNP